MGAKKLTAIGSRKAEAILVYLAVEGGVHSRDSLAALFWPESPQSKAMISLRVALSSLRKYVGDYLEITQITVTMKPGSRVYLDIFDLETNLAQNQIERALEIYQGDFLEGFHIQGSVEFEDWQLWEGERIRIIMVSTLQNAISTEIEMGDYKKGQHLARQLLRLDDLNEFAHHQYMLSLALDGQRNAALNHYKTCQQIFLVELGIEPSLEIQNLQQEIVRGEIKVQSKQFLSKHNLPLLQTSFIGREQEVDQLVQLLGTPSCRLLTLVGPGGFGKTRLAVKVASEIWQNYQDGAYFVPLEKVTSVIYLIPTIAEAIRFNLDDHISETDPIDQLLDYLSNCSMLIILDGYEHLIPDVRLVDLLLQNCPQLKILVTSRQKLNLKSEFTFLIKGLSVPTQNQAEFSEIPDSLQLFEERAAQANNEFHLSPGETPQAVRICRLVDGMPLGIELAATWTSVLSCQEIGDEIEKNIDFLETTMSDVPEKHRSLRAVFERSYNELTADQRIILSKISVFHGGFQRQSAQQIAGARLSHLSDLYNKSLIRRNIGGRMDMHRSIQHFAAEKLSKLPDEYKTTKENHARYFYKLVKDREHDLMGPGMVLAREEIRSDLENVRSALSWAISVWDQETLNNFIYQFFVFLLTHGWHIGILEIDTMIDQIRNVAGSGLLRDNPIILSLKIQKAFLLSNLGRYEESEEICQEVLEPLHKLNMKGELSVCVHNLGLNAIFRGELDTAIERLKQSIVLGRESGYVPWPSYYLWLGYTYYLLGEYEKGWKTLDKCYQVYESWGSSWGAAFALSKMGLAADALGKYDQALKYHLAALEIFKETGDQAGRAYCYSRMSTAAYFTEDYDQAIASGLQGFKEFENIGHRYGIIISQCRLAFAYIGKGDLQTAISLLYDALDDAWTHDMILLVLYSLMGLGCVFMLNGETDLGIKVFKFVKQHPTTPPLYINIALRWYHGYEGEIHDVGENEYDQISLESIIDEVSHAKHLLETV